MRAARSPKYNPQSFLESVDPLPDIDKHGKMADVLKPNQEVLVQVVKEPISTKGPRLSSEISLPGQYVVLVPFSSAVSVSKKIRSAAERRRLRVLAESLCPKNFGVIVRTAAEVVRMPQPSAVISRIFWKNGSAWHTWSNLPAPQPRC